MREAGFRVNKRATEAANRINSSQSKCHCDGDTIFSKREKQLSTCRAT